MSKEPNTDSESALRAMRRGVRRALAEKPPTLLAKMQNGAMISIEVKRLSGLVSDGLAEEMVAEALRSAGFSVEFTAGEETQTETDSETG